MNEERIKEQIRRCLAIKDRGPEKNEAEWNQAVAVATAQLRKLRMEEADFRAEQGEPQEIDLATVTMNRRAILTHYKTLSTWECALSNLACRFLGTVSHYRTRGYADVLKNGRVVSTPCTRLMFYGPKDDVDFAIELYEIIKADMIAVATLRHGDALQRGEAAAYCEGFVDRLTKMYVKEQERIESRSDKTALIVQRNELAVIDAARDWLAEAHGVRLKKGGSRSGAAHRKPSAYMQGSQDASGYSMPGRKAGYLT